MINTQALRNRILQLAVEGKLVPQIESEGTGAELLEEIRKSPQPPFKKGGKSKQKVEVACPLCKEGGPLAVGDFPFDIPKTWAWCRLGDENLSILISGQDLEPQEYSDENNGIPYLTGASCIDGNKIVINRWTCNPKKIAQKGDVLLTCKGTVGKIVELDEEKVHIARQFMAIRCEKQIKSFVKNVVLPYNVNFIESRANGIIPGIDRSTILNLPIPLPPLAEQKRIVAKVEEIFARLDKIDTAQKQYAQDQKSLKAKLLQLAVEGKLVPCDTSKWKQVKLGEIVENFDNERKPVTKSDRKTTKGTYNYYGATGVIDHVDDYLFEGEYLMIGEDGGNFFTDRDNSFIASGKFWANNHVHVVKPYDDDIKYIKYVLDSYDFAKMELITGIGVPKLNQKNLNRIPIPLPPLAEQKRIVAKLEELLPLCEEIG